MKLSRPVAALAVAALLVLSPTVALAQDQDPESTCGEALAAVNTAQGELSAAQEADAALAAGQATVQAETDAQAALDALPRQASDGSELVVTQEELDRLAAIHEDDPNYALAQEKITAITEIREAQATLEQAQQAAAEVDLVALTAAAETTDAAALQVTLDEATAVATAACQGEQGIPGAPGVPPVDEKDCGDFITRDQAQAVFNADPSDPHRLDDDADGLACESLPPASGEPTDNTGDAGSAGDVSGDFGQVGATEVPRGGVETGGGPA